MKMERAGSAALVLLLCLIPVSAMAEEFKCPDQVSVTQTLMEPMEAGSPWTIYSNETGSGPQTLSGVTVFDGRPEELASLVPEAQGEQSTWAFAAQKQRKIWMQCDYTNTSLKLVRELPDAVTRCTTMAVGTLSCE